MHEIESQYGKLLILSQEAIFKQIVSEIEDTIKHSDQPISIGLTGGSTPKAFYEWAAKKQVFTKHSLNNIRWMTSDERYVPLESAESNFGNADRLMLTPLNVPQDNKYPWSISDSPEEAAEHYNDLFAPNTGFNLCLLGMGDDCHIASIFPNSPLITSSPSENFTSINVPNKGTRLTITPYGLNHCQKILMIVTGNGKSSGLKEVLQGPFNPSEKPAQLHKNWASKVTWLINPEAAEKL